MIQILLIEDLESDATKIIRAIEKSSEGVFLEPLNCRRAETLGRGLETLKSGGIDLVLLDLGLPDAVGFEGIDRLKRDFPLLPIIVMTRLDDEAIIAVETVKRGAQDYFSKDDLHATDLGRIIRYAIERKKSVQDLVLAREEALRASRAKSEFLASMSHDIRTPINCIVGVADLLSASKTLTEEQRNYVQMLKRSSDNLLALINNVLDLSKIESGACVVEKRPFDILEVVDNVLDMIATRAHAKGLELIFGIAPDVPHTLIGDSGLINQVLINLLGNAVKFTARGEVALEISLASKAGERANGVLVQFTVRDSGAGIPGDKLETIFESFTQIENEDKSLKRQGSGLGLTICKHLVEIMGGDISVRSVVGQGSEFAFTLPLTVDTAARAKLGMRPDLLGRRVLIVDDNTVHARLLKEQLLHFGADVQLATNRDEADVIASSAAECGRKFAYAFVDLRMPGIASGGLELAGDLRRKVDSIIMMVPTNHRLGDIERIKAAGINKYFFKPSSPRRVQEALFGCDQTKPQEPASSASSVQNAKIRLLIADDSEDNREIVQAYCRSEAFLYELAEDGREAFELFKAKNFDLVLMDIQMPHMNGYEALRAIRQWEEANRRPRVPVLALTAYALKEEAEKCLAAGFDAHVTKPITKSELIHTIKKAIY